VTHPKISENIYPADIWAIKEYGIEKWLNNCRSEIVSEEEKYSIYSDIYEQYEDLILSLNSSSADLVIVTYKLLMEYHYVLYSILLQARASQEGRGLFFDPQGRSFISGILSENIQGIFVKDKIAVNPNYPTVLGNVISKGIMEGRGLKYLRKDKIFSIVHGDKVLLSYGYPKQALINYAYDAGKKIKMIHPYPFRKARAKHLNASSLAVKLLSIVRNVAITHGIVIPNNHYNYLSEVSADSLRNVELMIESFTKYLSQIPKTELLVPAFGKTEVRALCIAARRAGHSVVGSTHGSNIGIYKHSTWYNIDMSMCDKYLVPTDNSVNAFENYQKSHIISKKYKTKIISQRSTFYEETFHLLRKRILPKKYHNIMIVEFPQTPYLFPEPTLSGPFQLWLNIELAQLLKRHGFNPILKMHPDRIAESSDIYEKYYDQIITDRFEDSYDRADAIIFPYVNSTTFPFTLLTNKKVIIFESSLKYFIAEHAQHALRSRADVIDSYFDESKSFQFNDEQLIEALSETPELPSFEIVKTYYTNSNTSNI
jgi:hypothetical protein